MLLFLLAAAPAAAADDACSDWLIAQAAEPAGMFGAAEPIGIFGAAEPVGIFGAAEAKPPKPGEPPPAEPQAVRPGPAVTIYAARIDTDGQRRTIEARGDVHATMQSLSMDADELFFDEAHQTGTALGRVRLRSRQLDVTAELVTFDLGKELVEIDGVEGILLGKYHVAGRRLSATPQLIAMQRARFTNCLEDPRRIYLQVEELQFFPQLTEDDFTLHKISIWFSGARLFALPALSFDSNVRTGLPPRLRGVAGLQPLFLPRIGLDHQRGIVLGTQLNLISLPHDNVLGTVEFGTRGNLLLQLLHEHDFNRTAAMNLWLGYQSPDALGRVGAFGGGAFSYLFPDGTQLRIQAVGREEVPPRNAPSPIRPVVSRIPEGSLELAPRELAGLVLRPTSRLGFIFQEDNRALALRGQFGLDLASPSLTLAEGLSGQFVLTLLEGIYKRFRPAEAAPTHHGYANELLQVTHRVSPWFSYAPHLRARQVWGETPFTFDREVPEVTVGLRLTVDILDWWQIGTFSEWDFLRQDLINQQYYVTVTPFCYQFTLGWQQVGNSLDLRVRLLNL